MTSNAAPGSDGGARDEALAAQRILRRTVQQWPLVLACAVIAAVVAFVVSSAGEDQYAAKTTMQLNEIDYAAVLLGQNLQQQGQDARTKAETNARLVTTPAVRRAAAEKLSIADPDDLKGAVSVRAEPDTTLISITARDPDPARAAAIANELRKAFIADRRSVATEQASAARTSLERQLEALPASQEQSISAQTLQQRLIALTTMVDAAAAGVVTAEAAEPPTAPSSPRPRRDAILAFLLGGMLGLGVALLRAWRDDRLRDVDELRELWDVPVLGVIPESRELGQAGRRAPGGAALEPFALVRTNLRYSHVAGEVKTLAVTSAVAGEGKSTVTWNLALAAAMAGSRVLVVDADLRRPTLARRLGLQATGGLSEVLAGITHPKDLICRIDVDVPGGDGAPVQVDVLPAGFAPPSPVALLERAQTSDLLAALADRYDLVLIDTPPATLVADAKILIEHVDGVLLVARLGRLTRGALLEVRELVGDLHTPVLGTVVNSGAAAASYGYGPDEAPVAAGAA